MKKKIFISLVAIILLAVGAVWLSLESIVKTVVNKYGSEITGTEVKLGGFQFSPLNGTASVSGLTVANPKNYKSPYLFDLGSINVKVDVKSLATDTIVIEEINHGFDKTLIFIALIASIVADFISKSFFGQATALNFPLETIPLSSYWIFIVLGIVLGICGYIYNVGMIKSNDFWDRFPNIPLEAKFVLIFLIAGVVGLYIPEILDGGHFMLNILDFAIPSLGILVLLLVGK